ncbi:MAG: hypothetical protein HUJ66_03035 [Oscillospiraceae bacterium]|nr:hypothetical protein [Oscillospiraceae bacterium]
MKNPAYPPTGNAILRAYARGFRDGSGEAGRSSDTLPALVFGFFCWLAMLYFVFR